MPSLSWRWLALAAALLACGHPFEVVTKVGGALWLADAAVPGRARATADAALAAWGAPPGRLDGYTLTLEPGSGTVDCRGTPSVGCTTSDGGGGAIEVQVMSAPCAEVTALVHEMGHVALGGDPDHTDPRWYSAELGHQVVEALLAEVPPADPACAAALQALSGQATYLYSYGS